MSFVPAGIGSEGCHRHHTAMPSQAGAPTPYTAAEADLRCPGTGAPGVYTTSIDI